MLFSSIIFLSLFLPIALIGTYLSSAKYRNLVLLIISLIFYIWGEKALVLIMLFTITVNYLCCLLIDRGYRKLGLTLAVTISLAVLGVFKYANFAYSVCNDMLHAFGMRGIPFVLPQIILPLGISFYTFQTISYTVDVYRGDVKASRRFVDFVTYVSMFPHLVAGPIVRYHDIYLELKSRDILLSNVAAGIERFILGLAKKMIISNACAYVADQIFDANIQAVSSGGAWLGIIAYTLQIYFDFSAYSDMAIGLARMLGFHFLENFNYPYISKSIQDFWRRWHISLSSWFRDYVYIPLGGNRKGSKRTYVNLAIVFFATGLWHGASWNFIFWGLYHGLFLIIERLGFSKVLQRIWSPLAHIYTLLVVVIGWVFFRANTLTDAIAYLKKMFFISKSSVMPSLNLFYFFNRETIVVFTLGIIFSMPVFPVLRERMAASFPKVTLLKQGYYLTLLGLLVFLMMFLAVDTYNPFIYFRF